MVFYKFVKKSNKWKIASTLNELRGTISYREDTRELQLTTDDQIRFYNIP